MSNPDLTTGIRSGSAPTGRSSSPRCSRAGRSRSGPPSSWRQPELMFPVWWMTGVGYGGRCRRSQSLRGRGPDSRRRGRLWQRPPNRHWQAVGRMSSPAATACPNVADHTPHPTGYVSHSAWAADAMAVADQRICAGCERWAIWVPRRQDLRIAVNWPPSTCDWGSCDGEGAAERLNPDTGEWLPVCRTHVGPVPRRRSPGRGNCGSCSRSYALTAEGLLRTHNHGWERCVGSGQAPRGDAQ